MQERIHQILQSLSVELTSERQRRFVGLVPPRLGGDDVAVGVVGQSENRDLCEAEPSAKALDIGVIDATQLAWNGHERVPVIQYNCVDFGRLRTDANILAGSVGFRFELIGVMRGIDSQLAGNLRGIPGTLDRVGQSLSHGFAFLKSVAAAGRAWCDVSLGAVEVNRAYASADQGLGVLARVTDEVGREFHVRTRSE